MKNVLIVEAQFYPGIAKALRDGAAAVLKSSGARFEYLGVPGALEIPQAIAIAARASEKSGRIFDGYVALGCVIRGMTYHFEIVAQQSAAGLMKLSLQHGLCIGNGILTCESEQQALARSAPEGANKGGSAARACLALIETRARLEGSA